MEKYNNKKSFSRLLKKAVMTGIFLTVLLAVAVGVYLTVKPITMDCGISEIYSQAEIQSAIDCVKSDFQSLKGCKLHSLSYAGDESIIRETEYQLEHESQYDEYILIDSEFRSPILGGGGWSAARIYTWHWILGRNIGENWVVIDKGYC